MDLEESSREAIIDYTMRHLAMHHLLLHEIVAEEIEELVDGNLAECTTHCKHRDHRCALRS